MTVALIGFGGAILGALTALLGAVLADRRQARNEARRWRRDQLASAYEQTLRYLLRAANRRSEFVGGTGGAVLKQEHQREWFDDLVEAQVSLRTATRYCDASELDSLNTAAESLDRHVDRLISGQRYDEKNFSIWRVLQSCIAIVTECSRLDGSRKTTPASDALTTSATTVFTAGGHQNIRMASNIGMLATDTSGDKQGDHPATLDRLQ